MEYHTHDRAWVNEQLRSLPYALKDKAAAGYAAAYKEAYDLEPVEHKKSNAGRNAANTRLRIYKGKALHSHNKLL